MLSPSTASPDGHDGRQSVLSDDMYVGWLRARFNCDTAQNNQLYKYVSSYTSIVA